jgi:hypothetical protein
VAERGPRRRAGRRSPAHMSAAHASCLPRSDRPRVRRRDHPGRLALRAPALIRPHLATSGCRAVGLSLYHPAARPRPLAAPATGAQSASTPSTIKSNHDHFTEASIVADTGEVGPGPETGLHRHHPHEQTDGQRASLRIDPPVLAALDTSASGPAAAYRGAAQGGPAPRPTLNVQPTRAVYPVATAPRAATATAAVAAARAAAAGTRAAPKTSTATTTALPRIAR